MAYRVRPRPTLFSPDGKRLVASGGEDSLVVVNVDAGRLLYDLRVPKRQGVYSLAFSADGRMLAADVEINELVVWEVSTGKIRWQLSGPDIFPGLRWENEGALAFSPDNTLLAVAQPGRALCIWNIINGQELGPLKGHQGDVRSLVFSPDGKTLASGSTDATVLLWDVHTLRKELKQSAHTLSTKELQTHWKNLASDDAPKAFASLCAMIQAPQQTVPFLQQHLRAAKPLDTKHLSELITDLDSRSYQVRQRAQQELANMGKQAEPALRQILADKPSLEVRRRVEALLEQMEALRPTVEELRVLRAIEILERIDTLKARQMLQTLAEGAPATLATSEAKAALRRLSKD